MTIDYKQLKLFVKEAMFTGGGINEPSAPEGIPHRMPAASLSKRTGDEEANKLYGVALVAREATEALVVALDNPVFDDAYEFAFKASACLRKTLNSLESAGAEVAPEDRVVAPAQWEQPYNAGAPGMNGSASGVVWPGYLQQEGETTGEPPDNVRKNAIMSKLKDTQLASVSANIDTRVEFENDLKAFVLDASQRVKPEDIKVAVTKLLSSLRK